MNKLLKFWIEWKLCKMITAFCLELGKIPSKALALSQSSKCWRAVQDCFELQQDILSFLQLIGFDNERGMHYQLYHAFRRQE